MLTTLINLFGRSPFAPLESHMQKVASCVHMVPELFIEINKKDYHALEKIASKISELEHEADLTKNDIRNHLPKSLFLPIDRSHLLEILTIQDRIADTAEDVAILTTLKPIEMIDEFRGEFNLFLNKNIESFNSAQLIIKEMHSLLESSFGGNEAQKVKAMVDDVSFKEHEADLIQRQLLKHLFRSENKLSYTTFNLWQRIFEGIGAISDLSENLANRVRMTLDLK